jgi:hypothetical protein
MRIAQVAPLYEAVPPRLYGGTERIVAGEQVVAAGGHVIPALRYFDSPGL